MRIVLDKINICFNIFHLFAVAVVSVFLSHFRTMSKHFINKREFTVRSGLYRVNRLDGIGGLNTNNDYYYFSPNLPVYTKQIAVSIMAKHQMVDLYIVKISFQKVLT